MKDKLREVLSNYAHETWSGWMKYLFAKSTYNKDGSVTIPASLASRWYGQMNTNYQDLSEQMKNSDRTEADRMIIIFKETHET